MFLRLTLFLLTMLLLLLPATPCSADTGGVAFDAEAERTPNGTVRARLNARGETDRGKPLTVNPSLDNKSQRGMTTYTELLNRLAELCRDPESILNNSTFFSPCDNPIAVPVSDAVSSTPPALLGGLAVAQLTMPTPVPQIGPPPEINEWNMAAVGYPLWLWTDDTTAMSSSASVMGETVTLTARRTGVSFHMGDGNSVTCQRTTPWTKSVAPEHESPTCGYRYMKASLPEGNYQVVAVAEWEVTWSVLGETGMIPIQKAASTELPVGQLRSVVTGR